VVIGRRGVVRFSLMLFLDHPSHAREFAFVKCLDGAERNQRISGGRHGVAHLDRTSTTGPPPRDA